MSSYLNNLLTNTTSRYNNLRRQILSDEADGDTEDDSHLSRVLRAYYTEKGRPFPQWLPPDPKAPQPAPAQFVSSRQQAQAQTAGRGGGLNDLWDNPAPQQPPQEPQSLRRGPGARGGGARPMQGRPMGNSLTPDPQIQGRPLPSQRAGSYQSSLGGRPQAEASPPPSAGTGSGTTAQERLKARLWGRSQSPAPRGLSSESANSPSSPQAGRAPYPEDRSHSYGSTGSGGGRPQGSFGMSSNSPWSGNDDPYAPQGGGYGGGAPPPQRGPQGGRMGLPSGPRMR
ncbi:uncharacterized protein J4E78_006980 [Alternaria triticimaculans]|uniref:uncharacterized protein n=1 Tax=Alternaria triticimaculans TaxID=297637 RepID=UPI0020C57171|nr:uncharacterized protein J4E78_006980 [Alternaria triticimaculans]KAI4654803.1 hypothetical protein J4E78_006980 [Alternaria triticimaculans]